ncbi:saccharopine dehydrogenase NADP-binding domain-containing protein [Mycobacterium koreense]|uniref:Enoyl-ACP reductase n=1 Tax=Mycolicibacillus koreensis TaxID=1069220 RepID=A0A7I7S865_9MYCO|nr:saccharopine dehydrogenase NADP-binding domain-containing protein [Mycolicibacillus koreensis]MCV7249158.1 saccharopine dehydrogenase NADP-binding domain-containing protein [Mycolicibacillus koreensis]ODR05618.1 enoyl-ACP reductase [Mycolicibacillus koreensis]OSC32199.1 enoyl-ACP reductase [Mycolicibacillus koreensis]BBY53067.1 enoyl reductase [Mycolicibacillus koreensis]
MPEPQREFDLVLYGATGFVGTLTAQYLARAGGAARIALAGRNEDRLRAVRDALGPPAESWAILHADASEPASLTEMAERTRVVVSTVGPYTRYGLPLVAACAEAGTDYADLTGEAMFVRASIDGYHKQAVDTGARIVHACGFDSIPSDLSVYALHRQVVADGAGQMLDTDFVLRRFRGGMSGGTIASGMEMMHTASSDPEARRLVSDPYTFSADPAAEPQLGAQPDFPWRRGGEIAPELAGIWTGGFFMAPYNTRVVRRSNELLGWAYGRRFRYSEQMSLGSSKLASAAAALVTVGSKAAVAMGNRYFRLLPRRWVERLAPKPGTGPSESLRETGFYQAQTYTITTTGARYRASLSQQGDPGYKATAVLLGESALALALDRDRLSPLTGVLTPAAAMGDALLERFPAAEVMLEVSRLG